MSKENPKRNLPKKTQSKEQKPKTILKYYQYVFHAKLAVDNTSGADELVETDSFFLKR
jgi:hypothetical protein